MRSAIIKVLSDKDSTIFVNTQLNEDAFLPRSRTKMHIPMDTTDYSDSFCSLIHAQNVSPEPTNELMG